MSAEKDKKPMIRIRGANVNNLKKISVDPGQNFAHKPLLLPGKGQRQRKKKQDPCEKKDPQKQ